MYRNYEGYEEKFYQWKFQYFEGEEFGSWTNRMRVDGKNLDELEHLRHNKIDIRNIEDY